MTQQNQGSGDNAELRALWQARAASQGDHLNAVLFARLPTIANEALHEWHCRLVEREVLAHLPNGAAVLDLGCGYGRITQRALTSRPDLRLTGVDFSLDFCRLYQSRTDATAICAEVARLPFPDRCFDAVLAITVLMYIQPARVAAVIDALLDRLRPGGFLLIVDPGREYLALARRFGGSVTATGGDGFSFAFFTALAGGQPYQVGGMPMLSVCLPLALVLHRFPRVTRALLAAAAKIDRLLPWGRRLTLHRWLRVGPMGEHQ